MPALQETGLLLRQGKDMKDQIELPPLPNYIVSDEWGFTNAHMHDYGLRCIEADRQRRGEPVAWLRATDLERLAKPHVAGCAASLEKKPAKGFIPIFTTPQPAEPTQLGYTLSDVHEAYSRGKVAAATEPVKEDAKASVPSDADLMVIANEVVEQWQQNDDIPPMAWGFRDFLVSGMRALLARYGQPAQPVEDDTENQLRRLALQFDGHRMQTIGWLKSVVEHLPEQVAAPVKDFLKAPPLSGEKVLSERLVAMAQPAASAEPVRAPSDESLDNLADEFLWDTRAGRRELIRAALARYGNLSTNQQKIDTSENPVDGADINNLAASAAPILYQHTDGRYGLCLHGRPAAFTEGDPGWYRVPIDIVEPASEN